MKFVVDRVGAAARALAGALLLLWAAACGGGSDDTDHFNAVLLGSNVVPPVASASTALFGIEVKEGDTVIFYRGAVIGLEREEIAGIFLALGAAGENGPVLFALDAPLVDDETELDLEGVLTAEDLEPASGASFADAVAAIDEGRAYVLVQSTGNPAGEIRGTVIAGKPSRRGFDLF